MYSPFCQSPSSRRKNMRRTLLVPILALAGLLAAAVPAYADGPPAGAITGSHGRINKTVYHPTNRAWFVQIAVDTHFGYNGVADEDADFVSPVGRISKGQGSPRVQLEMLRLGYNSARPVVDDCRPMKGQPRDRNNGRSPCDPLHSSADYEPDVSTVLGSGDWVAIDCRVASRAFFSVRWQDGLVTRFSARSNYVDADLNGCRADLRVDKFATEGTEDKTTYTAPGDEFGYQINVINGGPDPAEGIVLVDTWPVGLDAPTSLEAGCTYDAATEKITCDVGTIQPGFMRILLFGARTNAAAAGTLSNTATVDAVTFDPVETNNRETFALAPA
jgi:uncharacterized repeat protein (TIGR01451 family)